MEQWSDWLNLKYLSENGWKKIPTEHGVYRIRWAKNGRPVTIHRLDGEDPEGVLYVGKTNISLRGRIKMFWRGLPEKPNKQKVPHTAANTYVQYNLKRKINPDELDVSFQEKRDRKEIDELETQELRKYLKQYLEGPPLNLSHKRWS